jgi:hypothetical protein
MTGLTQTLSLLAGVLLIACGQLHEQRPLPVETGGAGVGASAGAPGGAGAGGASAGSGGWVSPVAVETSQRWSWQECGRIVPDPSSDYASSATWSLALSQDGSVLLSNFGGLVIGWRVGEPFESSRPSLWTTSTEGGLNVAISPDGRLGTVSGDLRLVFDTATGNTISTLELRVPGDPACFGSELNFSPDGRFLAGKNWTPVVDVFDTETFSLMGQFKTAGCAQGIAFSADSGRIVAPDGSASIERLPHSVTPSRFSRPEEDVWTSLTRAPDGSFVEASCPLSACRGRRLDISDEGHWHVRAGNLRHVPSGEERVFDSRATEAVFAPNGDIIAGEDDASLVRFCRSE